MYTNTICRHETGYILTLTSCMAKIQNSNHVWQSAVFILIHVISNDTHN